MMVKAGDVVKAVYASHKARYGVVVKGPFRDGSSYEVQFTDRRSPTVCYRLGLWLVKDPVVAAKVHACIAMGVDYEAR